MKSFKSRGFGDFETEFSQTSHSAGKMDYSPEKWWWIVPYVRWNFFLPPGNCGSHLAAHYVNTDFKQESNYVFMNGRHTLKNALDNQEECWSLVW